jgi:hypothetical protein
LPGRLISLIFTVKPSVARARQKRTTVTGDRRGGGGENNVYTPEGVRKGNGEKRMALDAGCRKRGGVRSFSFAQSEINATRGAVRHRFTVGGKLSARTASVA